MTWTDERIAELKRLHAEGLSAAQIGVRLGFVTRNAVLGKIHRLGLSKPVEKTRRGRLSLRTRDPISVEDML